MSDKVDCDFCRIVRGEGAVRLVYETDEVLGFFPLYPATRGHTLVIPKVHVENFLQSTPEVAGSLAGAVVTVGRGLSNVFEPEGMNVITSAGEVASQTVMHLHIHVVPRWQGDAMGDIWPLQFPTKDSELDYDASRLRENLGQGKRDEQ